MGWVDLPGRCLTMQSLRDCVQESRLWILELTDRSLTSTFQMILTEVCVVCLNWFPQTGMWCAYHIFFSFFQAMELMVTKPTMFHAVFYWEIGKPLEIVQEWPKKEWGPGSLYIHTCYKNAEWGQKWICIDQVWYLRYLRQLGQAWTSGLPSGTPRLSPWHCKIMSCSQAMPLEVMKGSNPLKHKLYTRSTWVYSLQDTSQVWLCTNPRPDDTMALCFSVFALFTWVLTACEPKWPVSSEDHQQGNVF